jgi:glycosyltransferase involved in cell wall biosynthesis
LKKKNVLVLTYEYPPIGGGGGVVIKNICERLSKDFNFTVITTWFYGLEFEEKSSNIKIYRVKSLRRKEYQSNPLEMLSWSKQAYLKSQDLLQSQNFEFVISNFVVPGGLVAFKLKKRYNLPYVAISHGHDIPWVKPYSNYPYYILMYYKIKSIIENSEHTIVLSEELKNNALKLVKDENKIVQINNACDGVLFYDQKKDRGDKLKLLFVGRLVSQKGVRRLLKIAQMLDCKTDFRLRIVGDGPKRSRMESFVRKNNLSNKIVFLGNIPQVDLVNLYNESHFLLAPSLSEGMSLSAIESIFCSTPVLTTKVSGMMEVIDEKASLGKLFENNKKCINNIIEYLNNLDLKKDIGPINETSLKSFQLKFDWNIVSKKYKDLFDGIK